MSLRTRIASMGRTLFGVEAKWFPTFGSGWRLPGAAYDPLHWQKMGISSTAEASASTAAYACVNIISQELASLDWGHYRRREGGRAERQTDTAAARVLRAPNDYQTRVDLFLWLLLQLLYTGAAYAAATRNGRFEVEALHPLPSRGVWPAVDRESGEVFYSLSDFGDGLLDVGKTLPARNVLALRLNCTRHPLIGETPITAYAMSATAGAAMQRATAAMVQNMSRPSGVLKTPKPLTTEQRDELRKRWKEQTSGENVGETPILSHELEWVRTTMSAVDLEIIEAYKLSVRDIAMAYRIPLFMLSDYEKSTFSNVEQLMRTFYQSSLRFYLEHVESALNRLFGLNGESEYIEADIEAGLLRPDLASRMEAYAKGVQGGVLAPNEARAREYLAPVTGGDAVFVQQQMVPVSVAAKKTAEPAPAPPAPAVPEPEKPEEENAAFAEWKLREEVKKWRQAA